MIIDPSHNAGTIYQTIIMIIMIIDLYDNALILILIRRKRRN